MDVLLDEVDSLEAILMDDVKITKNCETGFPELIETTIFPTVGEDTDRQYICVTLQVMPKPGYPDISPNFQLIKPRGLDDYRLNEIKTACIRKLSDSLGYSVVFDLIDVIREHLTGSNLPSGQCVVCLYGFQEGDEFTKTECYHYLHSYCLARHLIASKKNYQEEQDKLPLWLKKMSDPFQATCPVCRESISDDSGNLKNSKPPSELECAPEFHLTNELKELQLKMTNLYLRQKSKGAIIDPDAEECNVISLGPDETSNVTDNFSDTKNHEYNQSAVLVTKENGSDQTVLNTQLSAQPNRRSNQPQQRSNQQQRQQSNNQQNNSNNTNTSQQQSAVASSNSSAKCTEESSSYPYNRHHRRNHHHHHHRSRRHHNHHYTSQNDSSQNHQSSDGGAASHQQKANIRASCGTGNR